MTKAIKIKPVKILVETQDILLVQTPVTLSNEDDTTTTNVDVIITNATKLPTQQQLQMQQQAGRLQIVGTPRSLSYSNLSQEELKFSSLVDRVLKEFGFEKA